MKLEDLLKRIPVLEMIGNQNADVSEIDFDSRKVGVDSLYVAIKGSVSDGHSFIDSAIYKGAKVIICETLPEILNQEVTYIKVKDASKTCLLYTSRCV